MTDLCRIVPIIAFAFVSLSSATLPANDGLVALVRLLDQIEDADAQLDVVTDNVFHWLPRKANKRRDTGCSVIRRKKRDGIR